MKYLSKPFFSLNLSSLIFGYPLKSQNQEENKVGVLGSIPIFGSSIISSEGYSVDEMLYVLVALGALGFAQMSKVSFGVILLLISIMLVYRKAIQKYPQGGGSYTIAREYLGVNYGLLAGAGLSLDYILTVAVSVSSAVENITGLIPWVSSTPNHKVGVIIAIIFFMTIINLRGLKESAALFALPVYCYLFSVLALVGYGIYKVLVFGVDPALVTPAIATTSNGLTLFLFLRALAGGTTALTGIEAISNGVAAYKAPAQKRATVTLFILGIMVAVGLSGLSFLASKYHTIPTPHNTIMNQLGLIIYGQTIMYYILMASSAIILVIAANTSFAGLPILLNLMARDGYMPRYFKNLGDRLVYDKGIWLLTIIGIVLVIIFKGDTHLMIPLYAVGVLIGFALTGIGLAKHTLKAKERNWMGDFIVFGFGGLVSLVVFLVFLITKFHEGAWIVAIILPAMIALFKQVHAIYQIEKEVIHPSTEDIELFANRIAEINQRRQSSDLSDYRNKCVVPVFDINKVVLKALLYAMESTPLVTAVHIASDMERAEKLRKHWIESNIGVELEIIESPYRAVIDDIMKYVDEVESDPRYASVTVVIPEYVPSKLLQNFLHNQTGQLLKLLLLLRKNIYVTSIPYHPPVNEKYKKTR
ncbi:APC family permease [Desulfosporosinus sp.]|uniref:APC family permease n=1 Tax=Desulfosporosinus sp. TaxID=157907 RepID=UPI00230DC34B|nr:APC family permease [Desulfosporosinus sp.]MDA8223523.1 APC family permease [Desulfitobacterium hafniense]